MRKALLYNPQLLFERLAELSTERRRLGMLRRTVASELQSGHIDSLELLELLKSNPPHVIYDIGANVGTWTLLARAIFSQAEIHAFEPLAIHKEAFARNTKQLDNVRLHGIALGNSTACTEMHVTSFSDASSVLTLAASGKEEWNIREIGREEVSMERLDDYVNSAFLPYPSLLKLDVQGYELNVLRGAERCLETASAVLAEVSFREFYFGQCLFHELTAFLAERGFQLFALGHGTPIGRPLIQTDALFLSPSAAEICRSESRNLDR